MERTTVDDVRVDGLDREAVGLRGKPTPDTFLEAARRLDAEPSRMVIVEDALAGLEAGRAGGFGLVIGMSRNGDPEALKAHGADLVVPDLSKIAVGHSGTAQLRSPLPARTTPPVGPPGAPVHPSAIPVPQLDSLGEAVEAGQWTLSYEGFDPALEGRREALFTLGNGYFATRGAAAEAVADGVHYPGTYLAGGYDRLTTEIAGRSVENEDLVNWPNWLPLAVRPDDRASQWFSPRSTAGLPAYRQDLDLRRGVYRRCVRFRDAVGRVTRLEECRFVHMREKHLAGLRLRVTAENWSGRLVVRSAIDGRATNAGVLRYKPFNGRHIEILDSAAVGSHTILIEAQTLQSGFASSRPPGHDSTGAIKRPSRTGNLFTNPASSARS